MVGVEVRDAGNTLDISIDGEPFAVYNFASEPQGNWSPYFHPVVGPSGVSITQNGEFPGTVRGHYWHRGIFIAHQKFTGGNTWEQTLGKHGRIRHAGFQQVTSGQESGAFQEQLEWLNAAGDRALLRETRHVVVPNRPPDRRALDFTLTLEPAGTEPLTLEATPYHLLAVRVADSMVPLGQKREYTQRYGRLVDFAPVERGGQIVNSEGQTNQGTLGSQARWIDFSGPLGPPDYPTCGIAILNHPRNSLRLTPFTNWNNMTVAAAPTYHEPHTLQPAQSLQLRYRLFLHAGDVVKGRVAEEYAAYAEA